MSATGIKQINADFGIFYGNVTCLSDINVSGLSVFNNLINGASSANLNALSTYSNLNIENLKLTSTSIFNNLNSFSTSAQLSINNLNATSTTIFNNLNSFSTNTILLINNKTNFNNLYISGASTFINTLNISGLTIINGSTTFYNNLNVSGLTLINGSTSFLNSINISGITNINGSTTFYNNLNVSGLTLINGSTSFLNRINISGITNINGSTTFFNTLNVSGLTLINGASTFINNLNVNGTLGLGMNSNQKLSVNGIGEFVNANSTKIILSTDVSNNSRHSISSNHDAGVGNNNYIDLNVWDNSLAATTLGTYNAARFHRNFTQFGGNRYVYINDVIIDRNVYNHIFTPLNIFHQTPTSSTVLNDNLPILTLARQGTGGQAFGARATFKISRWENNSTNSRTRLDLDLSHDAYNDVNIISFRSDGRVGIGNTAPGYRLDINGNTNVVGDYYDNGRILQDHLFNNTGRTHGTFTDFNTPTDFGCHFIQGSANGPSVNGAGQYYSMSLGLGSEYFNGSPNGNYKLQLACPRISSGNPYLCYRVMENNAWNGWMRIAAGYADSSGTSGSCSGNAASATTLSGSPSIISGTVQFNNFVGIGSNPTSTFLLTIGNTNNTVGPYTGTSYFGRTSGFVNNVNASYDLVSLYCTGSVVFGRWVASICDERIKKDIEDLNDDFILDKISLLKPKKYKYIDDIKKTENIFFGFIAQEVKEVVPEAVSVIKDYIPNIYKVFNISEDIITTEQDLTDKLNVNDKIKIMDEDNEKPEEFEILEISKNKIKIDKKMSGNKCFIYGKEVSDFHTLKKEYLFTLNICATQKIYKLIQQQQTIINDLINRISILESK